MRMLNKDHELFQAYFPSAASFLLAAELRYECYKLASASEVNTWAMARIKELLKCPACQEAWFVDLFHNDCRKNIESQEEKK